MRKILWMIILLGVYAWIMTSGHDQIVLQQGKAICQAVIAWFDDAEVDFQVKQKPKETKKRSRRWD